jgi:hypothetical protein
VGFVGRSGQQLADRPNHWLEKPGLGPQRLRKALYLCPKIVGFWDDETKTV